MSFLVTLPARPVPDTALMSTLCSAAILRTSGVDLRRKRSSVVSAAPLPPVASLTALDSAAAGAEAAAGGFLGIGRAGEGGSRGAVPGDGLDGAAASGAGGAPAGAAGFAGAGAPGEGAAGGFL